MSAALQQVSDDRWRLTGTLDFTTVPDLRPRIHPALKQGATVTIDLGGVTHTNSAGVALILQWMEDGRRQGALVQIQNPPRAFAELAGLSGARQLLGA